LKGLMIATTSFMAGRFPCDGWVLGGGLGFAGEPDSGIFPGSWHKKFACRS